MKIFIIYRKKNEALNETEDTYIAYRMSEDTAKNWIESQKNQMFPATHYYIKITDTSAKSEASND